MKSILRSGLIQSLFANLIWAYMVLVNRTTRWQVEGLEETEQVWNEMTSGLVFACWHSRILLLPVGWTRFMKRRAQDRGKPAMLISMSRDGEFVARAAEKLGVRVVRGSAANKKKKDKNKGGSAAVRETSEVLGENGVLCMTVDGPRGPRQRASLGAIRLAQRKHAKLMIYALAISPAKRMKSWDRFVVPGLFGKGAIVFAPEIDISRDRSPEDIRLELETVLNTATERAEQLVGGTFEQPDPIARPESVNDQKLAAE